MGRTDGQAIARRIGQVTRVSLATFLGSLACESQNAVAPLSSRLRGEADRIKITVHQASNDPGCIMELATAYSRYDLGQVVASICLPYTGGSPACFVVI